jgi:hypothetical protein
VDQATAGPSVTSSHRHGTTGKLATAGDVDTRLTALEARVTKLETAPVTPSGWKQVFSDDFTTWDPSRYFVYPDPWTNNYTGVYDPTIISSDGSKLRLNLHTRDGKPRIAAFCPVPTGSLSARGDLLGSRVEFRIRADLMPGYKGVPLLWPMSGVWPRDGEIDWPESSFDAQPKGFMHRQNATLGSDQDSWSSLTATRWLDWHTYALEWLPGVSMKAYQDAQLIKTVTDRVPTTAMHLVMQFETNLTMTAPDPAVSGYVEIDYLNVSVPA